jgi:hypothetical protein
MNFRTIKASVVSLLGAAEAGRFRTIGYQRQDIAGSEVLNNERTVQVFFSSGDFPKSGSSTNGPYKHDITFQIILTVAKKSFGDLATLNNPASTELQRQTAIASFSESESLVDDSFDELVDHVFQIINDARNRNLGAGFNIGSRWLNGITKNDYLYRGEMCVLSGAMSLTCTTDEQVTGETGTAGDIVDVTVEIDEDPGKAGVLTGGP